MSSSSRIAPPTAFLSLAPATSASYPAAPSSSRSNSVSSTTEVKQVQHVTVRALAKSSLAQSSLAQPEPITSQKESSAVIDGAELSIDGNTELTQTAAKQRRSSSSVSSESAQSLGKGQRFLKLGPTHWGENLDGHKGDWADME